MTNLKYRSVDVMKQTKDSIRDQLSDAQIAAVVRALAVGLNPTHIAISSPLDSTADFITNHNIPSPRSCEDHIKAWCDAIHKAGCKVMYRGTFSNMENIYDFPYLPYGSGGFIPQGTAASAPTDGTSTWLGRAYQRILVIGPYFRPGDIFAPFPEQTSYVFSGNSFLSTAGGIQANFANFFNDLISVVNAAFKALNIDGIVAGMTSNNYSEIRSGWMPGSVPSTAKITAVDYYGGYGGEPSDAATLYSDMKIIADSTGQPIFWEEWGDLLTEGDGITDRLLYFDQVMATVAALARDGYLIGFNYWGGWADQNTSILDYDPSDGTYSLNGQGLILQRYYNPPPQAVIDQQNGIGKTVKSKYQWLIYIRGELFADLTVLVQDRHFVLTRDDTDQIDCFINLDALEDYANILQINSQDILQAGVSEIRILRYGVVLTAGLLVQWDAELADERKVTLQFRGWLDLLHYRLITKTYTNQTALQIIQDVINTTQAKTFGDMGFVFGLVPSVDNTNLYPSKVYTNKSIYDIFQELSSDSGGIDFEITWDKKINIYYPSIGIIRQDIVFSYPGNVRDVKVSDDLTQAANSIVARGAGSGPAQITATSSDVNSQQKYFLREGIIDYPDISDQTQLQNLADAHKDLFKEEIILHDIQIDGSQDPQIGSFHLGDWVRLSVSRLLKLYAGVNGFFKIDKIDVKINNEEEETAEVFTNAPI